MAGVNQVCSSLRLQEPWASVPTQLLQSAPGVWKEARLGPHDIVLAIPHLDPDRFDNYNIFLVSASEADISKTADRIRELDHHRDSKRAAVFFSFPETGTAEGMLSFSKLQMQALNWPKTVPIVPVPALSLFAETLAAFQSSLGVSKAIHSVPADLARDVLPYCIASEPTSSEAADILKRSSFGLRDIIAALSTDQGRERVGEILGRERMEKMVKYWGQEFVTQ